MTPLVESGIEFFLDRCKVQLRAFELGVEFIHGSRIPVHRSVQQIHRCPLGLAKSGIDLGFHLVESVAHLPARAGQSLLRCCFDKTELNIEIFRRRANRLFALGRNPLLAADVVGKLADRLLRLLLMARQPRLELVLGSLYAAWKALARASSLSILLSMEALNVWILDINFCFHFP